MVFILIVSTLVLVLGYIVIDSYLNPKDAIADHLVKLINDIKEKQKHHL